MFARALIVLLLVLNVGVATWWALREQPPSPVATPTQGVASLRLLAEAASPSLARSLPPAATTPVASGKDPAHPGVEAKQCFSFGPFATVALANVARTRLQPLVMRIAEREQFTTPPRGWRVYLPPLPSPEAAQAEAQRMAAAGFSDFLVMHDGDEANSIALGRYRGEDTARRRADALLAAGFAAKAEPLDGTHPMTWLDVAADAGFDAAKAQASAAAPEQHGLDCSRLP